MEPSETVEDQVLLCETCEHLGPKLVAYVDSCGAIDAAQFYGHIPSADVREGVEEFVSRMLGADHSYARKGERWVVPFDSHRIVHTVRFLGTACAAFLYSFTLPDLCARGFVRPFTIIVVTQDAGKLLSYYKRLKAWLSDSVALLKAASFSYFLSRAKHISQASESIIAFYESKKGVPVYLRKAFSPLFGVTEDTGRDQRVDGNGGIPTPIAAPSVVLSDEAAMAEIVKFVGQLASECKMLDAMTTSLRNSALVGSITLIKLGGDGLGHTKPVPDLSATVSSEAASGAGTETSTGTIVTDGHEGLTHLSLQGWVAFLLSFIKKTPSPTPLRSIEKWLGTRPWHRSLTKLVLCLQVLDKHPMHLYLAELDNLSFLPPPGHARQEEAGSPEKRRGGEKEGGGGWGVRNVFLLFGTFYALCPQRLLEVAGGASTEAHLASLKHPGYHPHAPTLTSPYAFASQAASHASYMGLVSFFGSLREKDARGLMYSLLRGRPVFVLGAYEGNNEMDRSCVRGAVALLSIFVPSCRVIEERRHVDEGYAQQGVYNAVRVVPYTVTGVQLSHMNELRLCGIASREQLPLNAEKYCSVLNIETKEYIGIDYRSPPSGRDSLAGGPVVPEAPIPEKERSCHSYTTGCIEELIGKHKKWPSDSAMFHAFQAICLKLALRASLILNSLLVEQGAGAGGTAQPPAKSLSSICTPAMVSKLMGFAVPECDVGILDYLVRLLAEASIYVAGSSGALRPEDLLHLSGSHMSELASGAGGGGGRVVSPTMGGGGGGGGGSGGGPAQAAFPVMRLDVKPP